MAVSKQWALIRSWLRRTYNREVHEFFRDLPEELDLDNSTGRSATKAVCLIGANDSQGIANIKMQIFWNLKEEAGIGGESHHDGVALGDPWSLSKLPQVQLWFYEKKSVALARNRQRKRVRVSWRIRQENITLIELERIAERIRNKFVRPTLYNFNTGLDIWNYIDKKKGYNFQLPCESIVESRQLISDVHDINDDIPTWNKLRKSTAPDNDFRTTRTERVLGKQVRVSPQRTETKCYFRYAIAKVQPYPNDIPLVDVSGKYYRCMFRADNETANPI